MLRKILLSVWCYLSFTMAHAAIVLDSIPIAVPEGIPSWALALKNQIQADLIKGQPIAFATTCRFARPMPNVLICATYLQRDMNALLLRATIFTEGGIGQHPKHSVVSQEDPALINNAEVIGGHDITKNELVAFYQAATAACLQGRNNACLSQAEQAFYHAIMEPLAKRNFVLIAFSIQSEQARAKALVSHEYLHAQYFLNARYRKIITTVWRELPLKERHAIGNALGKIGYNTTDEELMKNEFQAYLLMDEAQESKLAAWVADLKPKLKRAIG